MSHAGIGYWRYYNELIIPPLCFQRFSSFSFIFFSKSWSCRFFKIINFSFRSTWLLKALSSVEVPCDRVNPRDYVVLTFRKPYILSFSVSPVSYSKSFQVIFWSVLRSVFISSVASWFNWSFRNIPSVNLVCGWYGCFFWSFRSKDCKFLTCLFRFSLIVFICFSNASLRGEYVNIASCIILFCCRGNISSSVRYSYLSLLPDDNLDIFAVDLLMSCYNFSSMILSLIVMTLFITSCNRFFKKRNRLSNERVVLMTYLFLIFSVLSLKFVRVNIRLINISDSLKLYCISNLHDKEVCSF